MSALRAQWMLAGVALFLIPIASAEGELRLSIEGELEPFALFEQRATVVVDVDCALFAGVPPAVTVELTVVDKPPWMEAFVEQRTLDADPASCPGARATLETELRMFWEPGAGTPPAGDLSTITLAAHAEDVRGAAFDATATREVVMGLLGQVRVAPGEVPLDVAPGDVVPFTLEIVNGYNAPVRVDLAPDARGAALGVSPTQQTAPADARTAVAFTATIPSTASEGSTVALSLSWNATAQGSHVGAGFADVQLPVTAGARTAGGSPSTTPATPADGANGEQAGVPAPGVAAALVALAAATARRRRLR